MSENPLNLPEKKMTFNLKPEQLKIYAWLKDQNLNTDENTLNYWARTYSAERLQEVVNFAKLRTKKGQKIRNIGGWIHKFLLSNLPVLNDVSKQNLKFAQQFIKENNWVNVKIYEKYLKDEITGDDLPLTLAQETFERAIESLFQKSQLYKLHKHY
jgi:hypothetical protein